MAGKESELGYVAELQKKQKLKDMNREVVDSIKRLKQGIEGVEYRVPDTINMMEYSDEEAEGEEIFAMEEAIDPKFLNTFSTDYKYEELTDEQKEIYDSLFKETEEILVGEEELKEEEAPLTFLDQIIKEAKGNVEISLPKLKPEDEEKKQSILEKEKLAVGQFLKLHPDNQPPTLKEQKPETDMAEKKRVKFDLPAEASEEGEEEEFGDEEEDDSDYLPGETPKQEFQKELTDEDFPPISFLQQNDKEAEELSNEEDHDVELEMSDDDDKELEKKIKHEVMMENELKKTLKEEYEDRSKPGFSEKKISEKEFNSIIEGHLSEMKKEGKRVAPAPAQKPEVKTFTAKGGGQVIFYFGGAKPEGSKKSKMLKEGLKDAKEKPEASVNDEKEEEEIEEEYSNCSADEGEEEEDGEGEEEEEDGDLDAEEKHDKYLKSIGLTVKMPLDQRIERDTKLPDTLCGLKVFKRTLLPQIMFKDDIAAQEAIYYEEDVDFSKPPEIFDGKCIREPIISFEPTHTILSRLEALKGATVVREVNMKKPKKTNNKDKRKKKQTDTEELKTDSLKKTTEVTNQEGEGREEGDSEDESVSLVKVRGETAEQRKVRKELVKKQKEERKDKKKKFKEKYELLKKSYLTQNLQHIKTDHTHGLPVYKIN